MSKILVVSDSHGNYSRLEQIIKDESPFDYIVHCGDGYKDLFQVDISPNVKKVQVVGNVDMAYDLQGEREAIFTVGSMRLMVLHGDKCNVKSGYYNLIKEGTRCQVDIVLFGHTHIQFYDRQNLHLFNPGTAAHGQYGVVMIDDKSVEFLHRVRQ